MEALWIAVGALVCAGAGAVLDPAGQRLADRSRAEDERRRAQHGQSEAAAFEGTGELPAQEGSGGRTPGSEAPQSGAPQSGAPQSGAPAPEAPELGAPEPDGIPVAAPRPTPYLPIGRSPARTVGVALLCAVLGGAVSGRFGLHPIAMAYWAFVVMLVTVSVTDLTHRLVPRRLIYAGLVVMVAVQVVVCAADRTWHDLAGAAIAGGVAFGLFFAIWFFVPRGMGFGDVRLAGVIGVGLGYLSLLHAYLGFLAGFVIGLLLGVVVMVGSGGGRKTRVPFGPPLAVGAVLAVIWGGPVAHALFTTV